MVDTICAVLKYNIHAVWSLKSHPWPLTIWHRKLIVCCNVWDECILQVFLPEMYTWTRKDRLSVGSHPLQHPHPETIWRPLQHCEMGHFHTICLISPKRWSDLHKNFTMNVYLDTEVPAKFVLEIIRIRTPQPGPYLPWQRGLCSPSAIVHCIVRYVLYIGKSQPDWRTGVASSLSPADTCTHPQRLSTGFSLRRLLQGNSSPFSAFEQCTYSVQEKHRLGLEYWKRL